MVGLFSLIILLVSGSLKLLPIDGLYSIPPLIAALTAVICCIGVTLTPVVASSKSTIFSSSDAAKVIILKVPTFWVRT